ncbi:MAG: SIMPL domain-containing protein [Patescibacteria group bacterium]|nr:SIMPL domain-containing protein [Patescibacteria group bacterium]
MTEKIKNYLGIAIIISILIIAVSCWNYVRYFRDSIEPSAFRSFSVSGEGKVVAVPDVAQFTFGVVTEGGKNIADLQKNNTEKVNKAIAFIKAQGVDSKDIKTRSYNLEPRYENYTCPREGGVCPPPKIVGYTINQSVLVKIRDFTKIGDILSDVIQNGANTISELQFTIDDLTEVQNKARAEAIDKARDKAYKMAEAGGFGVGRLLSIDENNNYYPRPAMYEKATLGMGGGDSQTLPAPTIEPGSQEVTANIVLRYEIK